MESHKYKEKYWEYIGHFVLTHVQDTELIVLCLKYNIWSFFYNIASTKEEQTEYAQICSELFTQ